jgi:hypothetical protein
MAMNELRALGANRIRHAPPPGVLDEIRKTGRRRLRLAAVGSGTAAILVSVGIVVGLGGAEHASGDRLVPGVPQPTVSPAHPHPGQRVVVAPPAAGSAVGPDTVTSMPSDPADPIVAMPVTSTPGMPTSAPYEMPTYSPSPSPAPTPSPSADAREPGVQEHTMVHRGLSACDVRSTPTGYCGRVTTSQATGVVTIVTEVCWSNGNTDAGSLTFNSTFETDDVVSQGGKQVWDWSQDKSFSDQTERLSLQPGDCWDWTTQWRPPYGTPSGTYDVRGTSHATELPAAQSSWTATFTLR